MPITAFQPTAFQTDAFQIFGGGGGAGGTGTGSTGADNDYPFGLEYWRRPPKRSAKRKAEREPVFSQEAPVPPPVPYADTLPPPVDATMQAAQIMVTEAQRRAARRRDEEALLFFL